MFPEAWASAKLAATLVVVGVIIIVSLATAGGRGRPEDNAAVEQSPTAHPASTSAEAGDDPFVSLTRDTFDELVVNADKPVVVVFTSKKCAVCRSVEGQIVELANQFKESVDFFRVGKYVAPELVMEFKVHAFPTVVFFTDGEQVDRWSSLDTKKLEAELNRLVAETQ